MPQRADDGNGTKQFYGSVACACAENHPKSRTVSGTSNSFLTAGTKCPRGIPLRDRFAGSSPASSGASRLIL